MESHVYKFCYCGYGIEGRIGLDGPGKVRRKEIVMSPKGYQYRSGWYAGECLFWSQSLDAASSESDDLQIEVVPIITLILRHAEVFVAYPRPLLDIPEIHDLAVSTIATL